MNVLSIEPEPFAELPYLNASSKGKIDRVSLPLIRGRVSGLPSGLDAIVAAADLQGREKLKLGPGRLLGERLAEELVDLARAGVVPPPERTGILLCGDLYTVPQLYRRGGSGDPETVWSAFAERFAWVAGVVGNHDDLGGRTAGAVCTGSSTHLLDGNTVSLDGLKIGGVGGIVGAPTRLNRKDATLFIRLIEHVLEEEPDLLLCHEGPDFPRLRRLGNPELREFLEVWAQARDRSGTDMPLVVCGHCWWPEVMVELAGGIQIVKVDARVVVLTRPESVPPADILGRPSRKQRGTTASPSPPLPIGKRIE